jgi:TonB-linked SusC/RagA family outer membrane protein
VGTVTGRVTEAVSGRPLANVQVSVVGTRLGALTNAEGRFTIAGVPDGPQTVRALLIGYAPLTRAVTVAPGQPVTADFTLSATATTLSAVVTVGYGTQRRQDVTGAVASVSVDDVPVSVTPNVGQMLQGRVAGAQVTQNNGAPGGGLSIRIRGTNSIAANTEPLYVIDGVPAVTGSGSSDPYQNPLGAINPSDIESIEVLKDASSTAIYGARGAAGVVLVTTKRGARGSSQVTVDASYGTQVAGREIPMLNATQFATLVNEARANANQTALYTPTQIAGFGAGTNWQDEVLQRAPQQNYTLSFSGGDDRTRYLLSGSYFDQSGIVIGSDFTRYSARVNLEREVTSRLSAGTNLTLSTTGNNIQSSDNTLGSSTVMGALWFNPVASVRNPDGSYVANSPVTWPITNPVANVLEQLQKRSIYNTVGNLYGEYELAEGLRLRSSLGLNANFERFRSYSPRTIPAGSGTNGSGSQTSSENYNIINENTLNYSRPVFGSNLDVLGGFTVQRNRFESVNAGNTQFSNDLLGAYGLGTGTVPTAGSNFTDWALLSYLGRANYNVADKYLFTLTGRADGSSRFGANNKWGFFPSAAFAWRAIDEGFMKNQRMFSDLKFRLSYGVTGNQEIGLYNSLARLAANNYAFGGASVVGYATANQAPNPDLKWETTQQGNVGLDMGWLDDRITASVDAYRSTTRDLLLGVSLPATSGYQTQLRNIGSVRNTGAELSLTTLNLTGARFSWRTTFNAAANRNEVVDLGRTREIPYTDDKGISGQTGGAVMVIREGEPLGTFVGLRTNGVYQQGDECPLRTRRATLDCVPGEYRYVDSNGDGSINSSDRVILGDAQPDWYGGLNNEFTVGGLSLNVFFQGTFGGQVLNGPAINIRNVNTLSNQTVDALNRWTPTNTNTSIPRANANRPRELYDVHVEDGSFIRLQSLTLGYRIPDRWARGLQNARVYVSGQNLKVWSDYTGFDPEVNSFGGDARARGIDLGAYPRARIWSLGTSMTF